MFYCETLFAGEDERAVANQVAQAGGRVFQVAEEVFRKMAYRDKPEGLLAVASIPAKLLEQLPYRGRPLFVVTENLEKPGNLGAIVRSADAAGADGLIVCDRLTDIYHPNSITASTGTVFRVPIAEAPADEAVSWLRDHGFQIFAATPNGRHSYTEVDMTGPTALAVGSEHLGLGEVILRHADCLVRIPMRGSADSLNVAATATVLLFEAARQRAV